MCRSPKLIAACHVLHRLSTPRHPLCALQSLIPCFEISLSRENPALRPHPPGNSPASGTNIPMEHSSLQSGFAVKIDVIWESEYIQGPQSLMKYAEFPPPHHFQTGFTPLRDYSRSINHISLHVDVKERAFCGACCLRHAASDSAVTPGPSAGNNGGPDRTRTYDPRLIKAVL